MGKKATQNITSVLRAEIQKAAQALSEGLVVAFPTETSYGLAVDPRNKKAVSRLLALKRRDPNKGLPLIASSRTMVKTLTILSSLETRLAKKYWPGPLTLVLRVRPEAELDARVVLGGTVAIRVSDHVVAKALARAYGFPIIATSANLSNEPSAFILSELSVIPDAVIDVGRLRPSKPSTIVHVDHGKVQILRKGALAKIIL